jgi:hypothetical protein
VPGCSRGAIEVFAQQWLHRLPLPFGPAGQRAGYWWEMDADSIEQSLQRVLATGDTVLNFEASSSGAFGIEALTMSASQHRVAVVKHGQAAAGQPVAVPAASRTQQAGRLRGIGTVPARDPDRS